ncbi:MAG: hypothetical protein JST75_06475 [Bacteroidetes bacterium]|nr:hypothetical protein [Bacteroidota bacterium]
MKNKYFVLLLLAIIMYACSKDNQSKPTLSVESVTSVVPLGGALEAKLKFTQKNGKLSGGVFFAVRKRLNIIPTPPNNMLADTIPGPIPTFPDKSKGEFVFTLQWADLHEDDDRNDTLALQFFAIDTQGDSSNFVTTPPFTVLSQ